MALTAPPGSGKTLLVPAFLKEQTDCSTVYVLEPRRVTARLPALALQEVLGQMVGYQIRFERAWHSQETTVGYLTYGTALRIFCGNPPKSDDIVIFDEFHERQWEAELLLAFLRSLTDGPRLLLMSATLDRESLPPEAPVIESDGRLHPVSVSHEAVEPQLLGSRERLATLVAERSAEWGSRVRGEQLIFLPGLGDIRAVQEKLLADHIEGPVDVLHSTLSEKEIRRVVERPAKSGFRRILSTDLAESSVTLPGIQVVLDSGLVRRPSRDRLDLGVTLRTVGAPVASLTQRAGRAGRDQWRETDGAHWARASAIDSLPNSKNCIARSSRDRRWRKPNIERCVSFSPLWSFWKVGATSNGSTLQIKRDWKIRSDGPNRPGCCKPAP